jgi:hypothetical protein
MIQFTKDEVAVIKPKTRNEKQLSDYYTSYGRTKLVRPKMETIRDFLESSKNFQFN